MTLIAFLLLPPKPERVYPSHQRLNQQRPNQYRIALWCVKTGEALAARRVDASPNPIHPKPGPNPDLLGARPHGVSLIYIDVQLLKLHSQPRMQADLAKGGPIECCEKDNVPIHVYGAWINLIACPLPPILNRPPHPLLPIPSYPPAFPSPSPLVPRPMHPSSLLHLHPGPPLSSPTPSAL